jgi:hypothetical protein
MATWYLSLTEQCSSGLASNYVLAWPDNLVGGNDAVKLAQFTAGTSTNLWLIGRGTFTVTASSTIAPGPVDKTLTNNDQTIPAGFPSNFQACCANFLPLVPFYVSNKYTDDLITSDILSGDTNSPFVVSQYVYNNIEYTTGTIALQSSILVANSLCSSSYGQLPSGSLVTSTCNDLGQPGQVPWDASTTVSYYNSLPNIKWEYSGGTDCFGNTITQYTVVGDRLSPGTIISTNYGGCVTIPDCAVAYTGTPTSNVITSGSSFVSCATCTATTNPSETWFYNATPCCGGSSIVISVNFSGNSVGNDTALNGVVFVGNDGLCYEIGSQTEPQPTSITPVTYYTGLEDNCIPCVSANPCPPTPTPTSTPTNTPSQTPTQTLTPTVTDTPTQTPTQTNTPTQTPTPTVTDTPTQTPTQTLTPTVTDTPTQTPTQTLTPTVTPSTSEPLDIYSFQSCCDNLVKFRYINVPGILSVGDFYLISGGTGFEGCAEVITYEDSGSIYSSGGVTFTQQDNCLDLDCPPCPSPTPTPTVTSSSPLNCNCLSYTIINPYDVTEYLAYEDCFSIPQNIEIDPVSTTIICACEGSLFNEGSLIVTQGGECPPPAESPLPTPTPTPTITVTPSNDWNLCDDDFCLVTYDPTLDLYNGTYSVSGSSLYNNRYVFSGDVTGVIYYNSTTLQWCLSDTIGGSCLLGGPSPSTSSCPDLWSVIFTNGVCNTTTSTTSPCDVFDFDAYFDCDVPVTPSPTPTNTPTPSFTPTPTPTTDICNYFTGNIGISGYTTTTTTNPSVTTTTTTVCYSASSGSVTFTVVNSLFICPGEVYVFIDCVTSQIYYVEPINAFADVDLNNGYAYSFNINGVPTCATFDGVQEISPNVVASGPVSMFTSCEECAFSTPTPTPTPTVTATQTNTPTVTPTNTVTPSITPTRTVTPTPSSATLDTSKTFFYQYEIGSSGTISFNTVINATQAKTVICNWWAAESSGAQGYGSNFIPPLNVGTFVAQTTVGSLPMPAGNYVVGNFPTVEGPTSVNYWVVIDGSGVVTQYTLIDPNC